MALRLLDGTNAVFDFQTDVNSTDLTSANVVSGVFPSSGSSNFDSWKCVANYASIDVQQEYIERTTFCTAGWRGRIGALKDMQGRLEGFQSRGAAISDPLYLFKGKAVPMILTADTGVTFSAMIVPARYHFGLRAMQNSEMGIDFASDGTYIAPATSGFIT